MSYARIRQWTRSWRFRLMLWSSVVVILTAALTLIGMQVGVRRALNQELDQFLTAEVNDIGELLAVEDVAAVVRRKQVQPGHPKHRGNGRFVMILDESGQILWDSDEQPGDLPLGLPFDSLRPTNIGQYRLVQRLTRDVTGKRLLVRVGVPTSVVDEDVALVDWLAFDVALVMLIAAPLMGYWLASRIANVLREFIGHTSRLRPNQFDQRLPVRGTGDELDQLAITFNSLLDRIASYLAHREDFIADAAHELRTPVAAIRTIAEVALGQTRSGTEYEEFLSDVVEECTELEQLINQLLLLADTDADRLSIVGQRVALDAVVRQSAQTLGALAASVEISLLTRIDPVTVEGNHQHLRQVVNNLLDNAVKFTSPGGEVRLELTQDDASGQAVLQIEDTGIGIAIEDQPHVFERFYRCDKSRPHAGLRRGTGLGLSICQAIVLAHSGEITVTSELGRGATFIVRLPLARRDPSSG